MDEKSRENELTASPPDQPAYRPFPLVAQAIRTQTNRIIDEWRRRTLLAIPELTELSVRQFRDDIGRILTVMADALESSEPIDLWRLVMAAPSHGFQRYTQDYNLADLFAEERILRRVIVERVESELARRCEPDEAAALHTMIDIMLQQGVVALVQRQKEELRESAESELKYLSFLSHDINNNFSVIAMNLEFVKRRLAQLPEMSETASFVSAAMRTMIRTRDGMRRLLEHEQLRKSNTVPRTALADLRTLAEPIVTLARTEAAQKNVRIDLEIDPGVIAETDADLVCIILQNLIGNAVKHAMGSAGVPSSVRIAASAASNEGAPHPGANSGKFWQVSVADDGPGIPPEKLEGLFEAFKTLPQPGRTGVADEEGFGLGLAIAGQAARLLGTSIHVQSEVGRGSVFSFCVPAPSGQL